MIKLDSKKVLIATRSHEWIDATQSPYVGFVEAAFDGGGVQQTITTAK